MNNKNNYLLGLVFAAALGLGAYFVMAPQQNGLVGSSFGAANATTLGEADPSLVVDMVMGEEDAQITMTEYASYTCPHCRSFHQGAFQNLKTDYIDTGKVRLTYREIYFDRYGLWGSIIARCGGQNKFFAISDFLYTKQSEWTKGSPSRDCRQFASDWDNCRAFARCRTGLFL